MSIKSLVIYNTAKRIQETVTVILSLSVSERWTISKARDSYGYNRCTIDDHNGLKTSCVGYGYDMTGTCLAKYVTGHPKLQARLTDYYETRASNFYDSETRTSSKSDGPEKTYGLTFDIKERKVRIDGATGYDNVIGLCAAADIHIIRQGYKGPRKWVYTGWDIFMGEKLF